MKKNLAKKVGCIGLVTVLALVTALPIITATNLNYPHNLVLDWQKTFGGINNDSAYSVTLLSDGGYVLAGKFQLDRDNTRIYLVKAGLNGNLVWQSILPFGPNSVQIGYCVSKTSDNGFIIAGNSIMANQNLLYLAKTDGGGQLTWSRMWGKPNTVNVGASVQQTSDGGYIITGWTTSYGAGAYDVWLINSFVEIIN